MNLASASVSDLATERIRELIHSGTLASGSKIKVEELVAEFRVSRTPIRDALARLEGEGLVSVVPRVGVYVRQIQMTEVFEVYTIKEAVEPVMAQWATERGSPTQRADFYESSRRLVELAAAEEVAEYVKHIEVRRLKLLDMAGSSVLVDVFRSIDARVRLLRSRNLHQSGRMQQSVREHVEIAEAVRDADGALAYELTRRHVQSATRSLINLMQDDERAEVEVEAP